MWKITSFAFSAFGQILIDVYSGFSLSLVVVWVRPVKTGLSNPALPVENISVTGNGLLTVMAPKGTHHVGKDFKNFTADSRKHDPPFSEIRKVKLETDLANFVHLY